MKEISLTRGMTAVVSEQDYEGLVQADEKCARPDCSRLRWVEDPLGMCWWDSRLAVDGCDWIGDTRARQITGEEAIDID